MGGSQGSHKINEIFIQSVSELKNKLDFQVIHICGNSDYDFLEKEYKKTGLMVALHKFFDNMDYAYTMADLAISRAGAVTITELAMFKLPAILIPYPHAGGHQRENAHVLCETRLARLIEQRELTSTKLIDAITEMVQQIKPGKNGHNDLLEKIYIEDAASRLAQEVIRLSV